MELTFGKRLRAARIAAKLTQQQIADLFTDKVTRNAVSNWEKDKNMPDPDKLVTIARAVHKSVDELLGRVPPPPGSDPLRDQLLKLFDDLSADSRHEILHFTNYQHSQEHSAKSTANPYAGVRRPLRRGVAITDARQKVKK